MVQAHGDFLYEDEFDALLLAIDGDMMVISMIFQRFS